MPLHQTMLSATEASFRSVNWKICGVTLSGCLKRVNKGCRESDLYSWRQRDCNDGLEKAVLRMESSPAHEFRVDRYILRRSSDLYRMKLQFHRHVPFGALATMLHLIYYTFQKCPSQIIYSNQV